MEIHYSSNTQGFVLSTVYKGYYYHMMYMGYTKREMDKLFRKYVKEESKKS